MAQGLTTAVVLHPEHEIASYSLWQCMCECLLISVRLAMGRTWLSNAGLAGCVCVYTVVPYDAFGGVGSMHVGSVVYCCMGHAARAVRGECRYRRLKSRHQAEKLRMFWGPA